MKTLYNINNEKMTNLGTPIEQLKKLLDVKIDMIIKNKNTSNNNFFDDINFEKVSIWDELSVNVWDKAEDIYEMIIKKIKRNINYKLIWYIEEVFEENKEKIDKNIEKKKFDDLSDNFENIIDKLEEVKWMVDIVKDIEENKEKIIEDLKKLNVIVELVNWEVSVNYWEKDKIIDVFKEYLDEGDYIFDIEEYILRNIYDDILSETISENLIIIETEIKGSSQSDWELYYIIFEYSEENIKLIEETTKLKYEEWEEQIQELISKLY